MKPNTTPTNVANLLTAAAYVRNETIINGNQAAQLDAMIGQIKDLTAKIEAVPAKIADLAAQGKGKAVAMWERMAARYKAQFADAIAELRAWLVDFKANRPNVNINLDEIDKPETPTNTTPANAAATTPAAKCLTMYLDNTREIYDRYTAPAIAELANKDRNNGGRTNWNNVISTLCTLDPCEPFRTLEGKICRAIDHARRLVHQLDGLTPTTADIDQAAHDYAAYIVECAQYENANA